MKRTSMQSKIPTEIREQLHDDPWMRYCCIKTSECSGRIEWHHAFTYAGKRRNEVWAILPVCHHHHVHEGALRYFLDDIMLYRMSYFGLREEAMKKYSRSNLLSDK